MPSRWKSEPFSHLEKTAYAKVLWCPMLELGLADLRNRKGTRKV
jgi:hypothetical protein